LNADRQKKGLQPYQLLPLIALIPVIGLFGYIQLQKLASRPRRASHPDTGTLRVETEPPGAELYVDGRLESTTPAMVSSLRCGEHTLQLLKRGFQPVEKTIVITKDTETHLSEALAQIRLGRLAVSSEPSRATVYLDGQRVGRTPLQLDDVRPGVHDLRLQRPAFEDVSEQVSIDPGVEKEVQYRLQPKGQQEQPPDIDQPSVPAGDVDDLVQCVERFHREIQHGAVDRAAEALNRALELVDGADVDAQGSGWLAHEIAEPYLVMYSYGDAAAVDRCRSAIETALLDQARRRPEQDWARALLLRLTRACERWQQLVDILGPDGLAVDRTDVWTLALYGEALVKTGRAAEAVDPLASAFRRNKECWRLNYALGLAYAGSGERVKARIKFKQALLHCNDENGTAEIRAALGAAGPRLK